MKQCGCSVFDGPIWGNYFPGVRCSTGLFGWVFFRQFDIRSEIFDIVVLKFDFRAFLSGFVGPCGRLKKNKKMKIELETQISNNSDRISNCRKKSPATKSRRTSNTGEIIPQNGPSNTEQPNCFIVSGSRRSCRQMHQVRCTCA